jgi:hypothetical protein
MPELEQLFPALLKSGRQTTSSWPSYVGLLENGEFARRAREAVDALADCACCPGGGFLLGRVQLELVEVLGAEWPLLSASVFWKVPSSMLRPRK